MCYVYWITGLSGAGKTSVGKLLYETMKQKYPNTVFLDGDVLREVFGNDLGYTREERIKCAMRYTRLCKMQLEQRKYRKFQGNLCEGIHGSVSKAESEGVVQYFYGSVKKTEAERSV